MTSPRKTARPDYEDQREAVPAGAGRAILALFAAVLIVFGGIMTFGGKVL
jgi:hypothetical protein